MLLRLKKVFKSPTIALMVLFLRGIFCLILQEGYFSLITSAGIWDEDDQVSHFMNIPASIWHVQKIH